MSSIASSNTLRDLATSRGPTRRSVHHGVSTSSDADGVPVAATGRRCLFTNLALWIGAFSLVLLTPNSMSTRRVGPRLLGHQVRGRWMLLAFFGLIQALAVVSIGDLIVACRPSLLIFVGTSIIISMVYVSIVTRRASASVEPVRRHHGHAEFPALPACTR